jgi:hypothetical protein
MQHSRPFALVSPPDLDAMRISGDQPFAILVRALGTRTPGGRLRARPDAGSPRALDA